LTISLTGRFKLEQQNMSIRHDKVLVLGSGSQLWPYLADVLQSAGYSGYCSGRQAPEGNANRFLWVPPAESPTDAERVISLLPLWLLAERMDVMANCRQLIAFGSTSSLIKEHSRDPREQAVAARLKWAETTIADRCKQRGTTWTILRPTLIYGAGRDRNITAVAQFISRWRFFPVAWPGTGSRQPVHAADLAMAAVACLDHPAASNAAFNLGGGETLPYRAMIRRIFHAMGRPARILYLPAILPALVMRLVGMHGEFSPALFHRMNMDLAFDFSSASNAFGYNPRPFIPELPAHLCLSQNG
jgi:nucleoside-diphosphate-sugar epimerase